MLWFTLSSINIFRVHIAALVPKIPDHLATSGVADLLARLQATSLRLRCVHVEEIQLADPRILVGATAHHTESLLAGAV